MLTTPLGPILESHHRHHLMPQDSFFGTILNESLQEGLHHRFQTFTWTETIEQFHYTTATTMNEQLQLHQLLPTLPPFGATMNEGATHLHPPITYTTTSKIPHVQLSPLHPSETRPSCHSTLLNLDTTHSGYLNH